MMLNMWKRTILFWALSAALLLVNVNNHGGQRSNTDLFQPVVAAVSDFLKPSVTSTTDIIAGNNSNGKGKEQTIRYRRTFLRKRTNNNVSKNDVAEEYQSIETRTTNDKDKRMLEDQDPAPEPGTGSEGDTGESNNSALEGQIQIAVLIFTVGTIFMPCGIGILCQLLSVVIYVFAFLNTFGFSIFI